MNTKCFFDKRKWMMQGEVFYTLSSLAERDERDQYLNDIMEQVGMSRKGINMDNSLPIIFYSIDINQTYLINYKNSLKICL